MAIKQAFILKLEFLKKKLIRMLSVTIYFPSIPLVTLPKDRRYINKVMISLLSSNSPSLDEI